MTLALALAGLPTAQAQDTVTMRNGDRLSGEVKSLDRGMLRFETDATDTIEIRWDYVEELVSEQNFQVMLDDGRQILGSLATGAAPSSLRVQTFAAPIDLPTVRVVRMTPIESRLIERIDMGVDLGFNLTKANDVAQANLGYNFAYRSEERLLRFDVDASRSISQDQTDSSRAKSSFSYRRFRRERDWDPVGLGEIERNDELGLRRRTSVGGGMSRWLTDTNRHRISFTGALVRSFEDAVDVPESTKNTEAMAELNLEWFRFEEPELDVTTRLTIYEKLTGSHRTRGNLDVDFRWELIRDFDWGFSIYYSFDSSPETVDASNADYGIVTSLGWNF